MKGTEKQIAWAQDIIDSTKRTIGNNLRRAGEMGQLGIADAIAWRIVKAWFEAGIPVMMEQDAGKIINMRHRYDSMAVVELANRISNDLRKGRSTEEQIAAQMGVKEY